jgi:protease-4
VSAQRFGAILLLAFALIGCTGRPHSATLGGTEGKKAKSTDSGDVLEFDLSSNFRESPGAGLLLPTPASRTYMGLIRDIERAASNPKARGFFVRLGETGVDWAHAEELGFAFQRLREKTGKSVICHANGLDNKAAWFFARGCTRAWVSPAGDVDTVGVAGQVVYLKSALDKLKITADFLHMGRYKSASEALTQDGPSDEARESLTAVLGSIRKTWLDGAVAAKKKNIAPALEDGPWSPDDAKAADLVDAVGYESDARADAETEAKSHHVVTAFGPKHEESSGFDASEILRLIAGAESGTKKAHIAVVPAEGSIAMGSSSALSDSGITARAMQRVIRRLASDDSVKAVVLRIDSPGGSALASDLIWHDLMELRKKKPLVTSVANMAASGGYYLACASTKIIAPETSIVGSIGVLGGKIVVADALAAIGVHTETFPASPSAGAAARAAYLSPLKQWDDATREKVRKQMEQVYELFLKRVSEGRGLPVPLIRAVAEGRIWSGTQGLRLRLVDEIGGLGKAIDVARRLAKMDADAPVVIDGIGETLLETLLGGNDDADEATVLALIARKKEAYGRALGPIAAPIRPFVSSLSPLLEGETTLAAMPFGLVIE